MVVYRGSQEDFRLKFRRKTTTPSKQRRKAVWQFRKLFGGMVLKRSHSLQFFHIRSSEHDHVRQYSLTFAHVLRKNFSHILTHILPIPSQPPDSGVQSSSGCVPQAAFAECEQFGEETTKLGVQIVLQQFGKYFGEISLHFGVQNISQQGNKAPR